MQKVVEWLIDCCFRPPREGYDNERTAIAITSGDSVYLRHPITFRNSNGKKLVGSLWYDKDYDIPHYCLVYLHSLGSNQFESLDLVPFICSNKLALCSFDFSGSGNSEGGYIPLDGSGIEDVEACISALTESFHFEKYAVWGRSMGAAIALHSASELDKFSCCVADSAFKDTESVVYDQAHLNGIPSFIIPIVKRIISIKAKEILGTNIISPYPMASLHKSKTPLLIGHGKQDSFITVSQANAIFEVYGCDDKAVYVFEGCHNTTRCSQWFEHASRFIHRKLGLEPSKRYYDNVVNNADIHSGTKGVVYFDINCAMRDYRKFRKISSKLDDEERIHNSDVSTDLKSA
ncbi:hypothetical protein TVAG_193710 [Trichomonas vaginalis G3]|uniref:Serine aminopeptidase S33 domain-containing protein n=1 Tax=Trichomonas vaginalis (strain ATCC PRA-98 / G3) TaxID=412133 RepID=A2EVM2_TRIV3|nr:palmitoyl-(protein) hydrolase protein [Trichomonas vaginalis G3]EAY03301.1 hypothetical protein TVAG_193710 [Trichomonas vaginalis G3]KAI5531755.1 palmitoyl-(protein) hydrolase protein [Trichomonas vaginalis G3]|eukprot:XP_001315524.1 hypothetical protein [Trichomonas vaginalis G3]